MELRHLVAYLTLALMIAVPWLLWRRAAKLRRERQKPINYIIPDLQTHDPAQDA
jgi:preprotein translocase subunit YajC